ncbi:MAG: response regulator, partial [Planctomycetia bacterium]
KRSSIQRSTGIDRTAARRRVGGVPVTAEADRFSILIADDDDPHRLTLRDIFEQSGFRTLMACGGLETLRIVEDDPVDCLLLDVHMPDLDGLATLQAVRASRSMAPLQRLLPCVFLTADMSDGVLRRALSLNAFSVLTKPVSRELVTTTVLRALRRGPQAV